MEPHLPKAVPASEISPDAGLREIIPPSTDRWSQHMPDSALRRAAISRRRSGRGHDGQ